MSELVFQLIPTGRTHQVGGSFEPIKGADGEPEQEWALGAVVDGHLVPLQTYSVGYVEHLVSRDDTAVGQADTTTDTAATPAAGQADLDAANARIAELEAQLEQAQQPPAPEQQQT